MTSFKALLVEKQEDKSFTRNVTQRSLDDLPEGTLLIKVHYSSLNYKDALSATGNPGVSRNFPHTPGIDARVQWYRVVTIALKKETKLLSPDLTSA